MPILASLGTANDRAFGFGDSSFSSGYDLPVIITNNAEIIYDVSNPNSVVTGNFEPEFLGSQKITFLNWKFYFPKDTPVVVGDYVGMSEVNGSPVIPALYFYPIISITPHPTDPDAIVVEVGYSGLAYSGITKAMISPVVGVNRWYDISGNDRHASLGGTPTITGAGANQYFVFTDTNNAQVPSAIETPVGGGNADFVYYFVANLTGSDPIFSTQWHVDIFSGASKIVFEAKNGSGSSSITDTDNYNPVGWRLFKVTVSASYTDRGFTFSDSKSVRTDLGGQTGFATSFLSNNTGGNRTFSSFTAQDGAAIKFVSLYATANDPGLTNVYNALKGRFGL
jgi:hypothetical protein